MHFVPNGLSVYLEVIFRIYYTSIITLEMYLLTFEMFQLAKYCMTIEIESNIMFNISRSFNFFYYYIFIILKYSLTLSVREKTTKYLAITIKIYLQ